MVTRIFLCNEQTEPEIRDFIREAIADISEGIDSQANNFRIWVAWDACVTFDEPLRTDYLRQLPHFQGMPLEPQTDAGVFREEYVRMLDREWEKQTQKAFRAGKGISLIDVYYRWGLEDIQQGFPQDALESFRQALKLN